MPASSVLCNHLNYQFRDENLLITALSRRSSGKRNYERLEFLGDSIVGFLIAEVLFQLFPNVTEGELSRYRAELVQQSTLADVAKKLHLGDFLILGSGERKDGGAKRDSILSDVLESVISAIYLDGGLEACRMAVLPWFESRLDALSKKPLLKDAKTRLQEHMQSAKTRLPMYKITNIEGEDHNQTFYVSCKVGTLKQDIEGVGGSKREAEQNAAEKALAFLNSDGKQK